MNKQIYKFIEGVRRQSFDQYSVTDEESYEPKNLPVPNLKQTLENYLKCIEPIVSKEELTHTKLLCAENEENLKHLQKCLIQFSQKEINWVTKWWLDKFYLSARLPLCINSNPGMIFQRKNFNDIQHYLKYTARIISGMLDYKNIIDSHEMPIDRAHHSEKGQPLCMDQYQWLFRTYRRPGLSYDRQIRNSNHEDIYEYICVMINNNIYLIMIGVNVNNHSENDVYHQLCLIYDMALESEKDQCLGYFTSLPRNEWAT
ncbi:hypothetical protein A3Q56_07417, partial [Intoshia linei]